MNKPNYKQIFERYISGEASPDEILLLKSFFDSNKDFEQWLENKISASSTTIEPDTEMRMLRNIRMQAGYHSEFYEGNDNKNKRFKVYLRRISNVAAVLLPFVIAFSIYLYIRPQKQEIFEVVANRGEKANLTLPEGSALIINSDSKIIYGNTYNQKERLLKLEGEAFFDVKHDPDKPFIVECGDIKVRVLGTSFGIKSYANEDDISIVLDSGEILLLTPEEQIAMQPNDRIIYSKSNKTTIREKVNASDFIDWRYNRLRFENETLEAIMNTISRMHNIDIEFVDSGLKQQKFTGTIDNTDIKSVLDAIVLTSESINYRIREGSVYLYIKP